jgi:hypothetical protein
MKFGGHEEENGAPEARPHVAAMFAVVALTLMLTACGGSLEVEFIGRAEIRKAAASKPVVVGQLRIRSAAGRPIFPTGPVLSYENPQEGAWVRLVQLTDDSKAFKTFSGVNANGRFAWAIKPGTYVIDLIFGESTIMAPRAPSSFFYPFWNICPKTAFRVEQSAGIVNLGEIVIDLPSSSLKEGQSKSDFCKESKNQVNVTQNDGKITMLVRQPLTAVVFAPDLPQLWDSSTIGIHAGNVPEALAVLRRHGVTISADDSR